MRDVVLRYKSFKVRAILFCETVFFVVVVVVVVRVLSAVFVFNLTLTLMLDFLYYFFLQIASKGLCHNER